RFECFDARLADRDHDRLAAQAYVADGSVLGHGQFAYAVAVEHAEHAFRRTNHDAVAGERGEAHSLGGLMDRLRLAFRIAELDASSHLRGEHAGPRFFEPGERIEPCAGLGDAELARRDAFDAPAGDRIA